VELARAAWIAIVAEGSAAHTFGDALQGVVLDGFFFIDRNVVAGLPQRRDELVCATAVRVEGRDPVLASRCKAAPLLVFLGDDFSDARGTTALRALWSISGAIGIVAAELVCADTLDAGLRRARAIGIREAFDAELAA
jgi:hypothetical protein